MADKREPTLREEFAPLYHGIVKSEGVKRLSVALGGLCASALSVALWIGSTFYSRPGYTLRWGLVALTIALAFFIPWGLVQVIGWVVEGFAHKDPSGNG